MKEKNLTSSLVKNLLIFIQKVHEKEGVDQELNKCLKNKEYVPKELAMILIDMVAVLHTDALYYPEDYRSEIYLAADQLSTEAYELCSN